MVKLVAEMENNHSPGSTRIVRDGSDVCFVDQYLLECGDEELSEIQTWTYRKTGEVLEFANALSSLQVTNCNLQNAQGSRPIVRSTTPGVIASTASPTSQQIYIPSQNGLQNGGYVMVDNNMKFVVTPTTASSVRPSTRVAPSAATPRAVPPRPRAPMVNSIARPVRAAVQLPMVATPKTNIIAKPRQAMLPAASSTVVVPSVRKPIDAAPVVDLTDDDNRTIIEPDEVPQIVPGTVGSKRDAQEKTYPSLVVTARTNLCNKLYSQAVMNTERQLLDNRLKRTLQMQTGMFTEHLLQQRLIKCDQVCSEHPNVKLKLGMYSDAQKFPFSGGYVWIADCCPSTFTSVFRGSIFEIGPHPPTTILKLLYHWACQTSVPNVLQWVKVEASFLKTFYTYLRAVCIAALHEKWTLMGGPGSGSKRIEVGVISLGTSTSAGGVREVKVDILGAMDYENKRLRLKALDHLNVGETAGRPNEIYQKKFQRILEVLSKWVHPKATIVTDFTIDKNLCNSFGFINMSQSTDPKFSNGHIMDYLRFVVPRMFQNTLNLLSRSIIQQFLDELVWRETWGHIPSKAYDAIIEHLAEQTKLEGPEDVSVRYSVISSNPNKNWKYAMWPTNMSQVVPKKVATTGVKSVHRVVKTPKGAAVVIPKRTTPVSIQLPTTPAPAPQSAPPTTTADGNYPELAKIALEPYYYGTIQGDPSRQKPTGLFGAFLTECVLCSKDLFSSSAFTNHLVHHALNPSSAMQADQHNSLRLICRFCMKPVVNLENHVKEFHKHSHLVKKTMCKICNTIHRDEAALISHMIYTHVELDMPYFCEICSYRTSVYQDMLVHFEKCHNKDTCVQCPFCLKIVRFAARNGEDIPNNQMYFIQHIQKHTIARQVRKCEKCALSFTNLSTLKNHQEFFHSSCVDYENVERYDLNPNDFILMSAPLVDPPPPMSLADNENFTLKGVPLAPSIKVSDDLKVFLCAECDGPITPRHFCVRMTCTKCRFQTCCANAVKDHNALTHSPSPLASGVLPIKHFIGGRPIMPKAMYCNVCLFATNNGNRMATHLASFHAENEKARAVGDKRKATSSFMIEPAPAPAVSDTPEPTFTETPEPAVTETPEPTMTETPEPEVPEQMEVDEEDPPPKRRKSSVSSVASD